MKVLTTETLASAINYSPEYSHMGDDESSYLAEHILNFFGYSDRIIDNVIAELYIRNTNQFSTKIWYILVSV